MTHEEAVAKARDIANAVLAPHAVENDLTAKHTAGTSAGPHRGTLVYTRQRS